MLNEIKNYVLICVAFLVVYFGGKIKGKNENTENTNTNSLRDIIQSKKNNSDIDRLSDAAISEQLSPFRKKS